MNNNLDQRNITMNKLKIEVGIIIVLMICLCITTVALAFSSVTTKNTFQTDAIDIILNNGNKIISENDQSIAPGKTIVTTFPLKNNSDHDVYYRLYFYNIKDGEGNLADFLDVKIKLVSTGETLYENTMPNLIRSKVNPIKTPLKAHEEIMLEATFFLPESAKNNLQGEGVTFDFVAEAVQSANNDEMNFGDETSPIDPDDIIASIEDESTEDSGIDSDNDGKIDSEDSEDNKDSEDSENPEDSTTVAGDVGSDTAEAEDDISTPTN